MKNAGNDTLTLNTNKLDISLVVKPKQSTAARLRPPAAKSKTATLEGTVRRMKLRLQWIVQTSPGGSFQSFADLMTQEGCRVNPSTVGRWVDPRNEYTPGAKELWVMTLIRPDISIDWLLGRTQAGSVAEQFIEESIKRTR